MIKAFAKSQIRVVAVLIVPVLYLSFNCIGRKQEHLNLFHYRGKNLSEFGREIILLDSGSNVHDISNFTGSVYLLQFYSNDCEGCDRHQKMVRKISGKYMKKRLRVVRIDDGSKDSFEEFTASQTGKDFQLYDENGMLTRNMQISTLPAEFLVDEHGVIRHFSMGQQAFTEKEYMEENTVRIDSLISGLESPQ
jgi:peroxiredoxin